MRLKPPEILQDPHPLLRTVCTGVDNFDAWLLYLIGQMKLAMEHPTVKCIGLAANQIGETKRVIVVEQGGQKIALVNPVITFSTGIQTVKDGCMSVKGGTYFRTRTRPRLIGVEYQDETGTGRRRRAEGQNAAAICHEVEHLDGKLFTDGLEDVA